MVPNHFGIHQLMQQYPTCQLEMKNYPSWICKEGDKCHQLINANKHLNRAALCELWKNSNDVVQEIGVNDFIDKFNFRLKIIQCHDYFDMYKTKAIYSMHILLNKFVVPPFILSKCVKLCL